MKELLWIIPALPFLGAFLLIIAGTKIPRGIAAAIGAGSIGLSALITVIVGLDFISSPEESFKQLLWKWIEVGDFKTSFAFYLDALSLVFIFVITFVGFLIHLYSIEFMAED
ncbi:MAG TPA: NADH-quinone oxidoreductase subunit L, partial [Chryseolinea sp.]